MAGKVNEYCVDEWDQEVFSRYRAGDFTPPAGRYHCIRGGNWFTDLKACFTSHKRGFDGEIDYAAPWVGFRVAMSAPR